MAYVDYEAIYLIIALSESSDASILLGRSEFSHEVNPSFSILVYAAGFFEERPGMWDPSWTRPRGSESRFRPLVGRDFELEDVHVIDAHTRGFLSRAIAIGAGAVAVSGLYGMATGSYLAVEVVWAVAGPMFGALPTHYFGSAGKDAR
jgi:hypothetical protein